LLAFIALRAYTGNAAATLPMKPKRRMWPPRPAQDLMKPRGALPGAPFFNFGALMCSSIGGHPMTQSLGEYRVGIDFNPSGNEMVNKIKRAAADLIDLIDDDIPVGAGADAQEIARLKALAMTHIEDAAMWAVKAATKKPR
jgi:hypothetical protein